MGQGGRAGPPSFEPQSPVPPPMGRSVDRSLYDNSRSPAPESRSYSSGSRSSGSRGYSSQGQGYSGSSRPPLNMRQPIVTPRSNGGNGYGSSPYGGNHGGHSSRQRDP